MALVRNLGERLGAEEVIAKMMQAMNDAGVDAGSVEFSLAGKGLCLALWEDGRDLWVWLGTVLFVSLLREGVGGGGKVCGLLLPFIFIAALFFH